MNAGRARVRAVEAAATWGYRAGWAALRLVPEGAAYAAFDLVARVVARRRGPSVRRLRANYAKVRPELDELSLDRLTTRGVQSYLRYWCEAFLLPTWSPQRIWVAMRLEGEPDAQRLLRSGGSAVMFLGHLGNWDICGAWSTLHLAQATTVAERLRPAGLFDQFLAFRESLGMRIIPLDAGSQVFGQLRAALRAGAFVALLADRDLTSGGVEVSLCGHPARMAVGPAALALATGAPLHPVSVWYEPLPGRGLLRRYRTVARIHPRVPVPAQGTSRDRAAAMTQACADVIGATVRERTQDWHMMQRVFLADLDADRLPAVPRSKRAQGKTFDAGDPAVSQGAIRPAGGRR